MPDSLPLPDSDHDFRRAQLAIARGWLTREQLDAAVRAREKTPTTPLFSMLPLTEDQIRLLETLSDTSASDGPATRRFPSEVQEAMKEPEKHVGRYWLVAHLGAGGMGTVYRAWDIDLGRWVAIKFLKQIGDETARALFQREAQLAASLSHPNIAAIYEIGEHKGQPFIAMQYVDGQNLWKARSTLSRELIARLMKDVADAVHAAHEKGIVHRDLKPANLMLDSAGRVYVMDFGLAKQTEVEGQAALSGSNVILGTPQYMSPEQARGNLKEVDRASDVYSLGATLYDLLVGRPPFQSESAGDVIVKVLKEEPVRPRKLVKDLPVDLENIALKCLEKEKARRYASARQLGDDIQRFLSGEPVLAHAPSLMYRASKRVRKYPAASALAVALVLLLPLGGYYAWRSVSEARERAREEELRKKREAELLKKSDELKKKSTALGETQAAFELWQSLAPILSEAEIQARAGETEAARKRLRDGVAVCEKSIGQRDTSHAHLFLSLFHSRLGREADSRREIETALKVDPSMAEARHERGLLTLREYARSLDRARLTYWSLNMKGQGASDAVGGMVASSSADKELAASDDASASKATPERLEEVYPNLLSLRRDAEEDLSIPVKTAFYLKEPDRQVGLAGLARLSGRLDEAAKRLDAAAKSAPDHEGVLLDRARLARSKGDLKGAIALCEQAAQRHRGLAEAYRLIAEIQLERAKATKDEAEKKSLLEAAIEPADRAVALNDQDVESWECRSKVRAGLGAAEKDEAKRKELRAQALADIEAAIKLDPNEPRLYEERASRHYDIFVQDFDAGATLDAYHEDYEQILRLQPEHPYALSARGGTYLLVAEALSDKTKVNEEYFGKALADMDRFAAQFPKTGYSFRGSVHRRRGDAQAAAGVDPVAGYDLAIADYARAIENDPKLEEAWRNRGIVRYTIAQRVPERADECRRLAIEDFEAAARLDPKNVDSPNYCGLSRYSLAFDAKDAKSASELMGQAAADFARAVEVSPESINPPRNCALALSWKAHYDLQLGIDPRQTLQESLKAVSRGIVLSTTSSIFWSARAQIWEEMAAAEERFNGDPSIAFREVVKDASIALRLDPNDEDPLERRARAYLGLARVDRPKEWIAKALEDRTTLARRNPFNFSFVRKQVECWTELARLCPDEADRFHEGAIQLLSKAARRKVGLPDVRMDLSAEHWNKAEFEAGAGLDPRPSYALALKAIGEHIDAAPTSEAYERRAAIYEYLAAWEKANEIDPLPSLRRALAAANEAVKAEGNRAIAFARRGRIRQSFGEEKTGQDALKQYKAGIADLTRAIELEKSPGMDRFAVRGLLYILAGSLMPAEEQEAEYRKAVADYDKAIELAPNDAQQLRSRSRAHLWVMQSVSDRPEKALGCAKLSVDDARRAAEIEPSAQSYQYLGEALCILAERGEQSAWRDALKAYEQAANLAPLDESYQAKIEELKAKVAPK